MRLNGGKVAGLPELTLVRLLTFLVALTAGTLSQAAPAVALYYGDATPLKEFRAFDIVVVEPDHGHDPRRDGRPDSQLYAYVSVAEVQASRGYHKDIPTAWKIARNATWNADVVDQAAAGWPEFFAERVVGPLWEKGYRGFFLDALDAYRLAPASDEAAQQRGLVRVIETLHERFPGIRLILNRGFEIVPRVRDKIVMVAAESLFEGWNEGTRSYGPVNPGDRQWLLDQLNTIRERDRLDILVIDYVAPHDRKLTRETAEKIRALGFIPWVADGRLESLGIGAIETVPRRVLVIYDSGESPALNYANAHRFLQMPLNHLGYVVDYADVRQPLPAGIAADRYAGVATWFSGGIPDNLGRPLARWLLQRIDESLPVAIVGDLGFAPDRDFAARLGLRLATPNATESAQKISRQHRMLGFETAPHPDRTEIYPFASATTGEPLIELQDARDNRYLGGALMPWGGFILDPFAVTEVPGTEQARWVVDPFAFLRAALRLPAIPVPDVTTENGRRLLFSHIDGDGFPSFAELPGAPLAAEALLKEVLERRRIPTTVSVIEAEVSPGGLHPKLSQRLEDVARRMFRLPHVEIASHTFAHPFRWDNTVSHGAYQNGDTAYYHLDVPGYRFDLNREIVGSTAYIRERLAPAGKPVRILLWSGDTAPNEEALRVAEAAGLLNMNGGDTAITRGNPSLTAVGALGIRKNGFLQVYAPVTNENLYTNLWRGPFYGYERVIETFEMTERPRRLKPVGIYYHTYSASKRAGLAALNKVFAWAGAQPLHPVFASEYILKVRDFHELAIARDGDGWRIRGNGDLRTLRLPEGRPDIARSSGVAGFRDGPEGGYVHLAGGSATLHTGGGRTPALHEANARLGDWRRAANGLSLTLRGHVPVEFSLADAAGCQVRADGRPLTPVRAARHGDTPIHAYRLNDAAAQIQVTCRDR